MKVSHVSPSSLNRYYNCPFRWKCKKLELPEIKVPTKKQRLGKTIHNIIDLYFRRLEGRPKLTEIPELVEESWNDGYKPVLDSLEEKAEQIKENFINFEQDRLNSWNEYVPTFTEQDLKTKREGLLFLGTVDFYGNDTIIDWKTGSPNMRKNKLRQGKFYEFLLQENGYNVDKVLFVFLDPGVTKEVPDVPDNWFPGEVRRMLKGVLNEEFEPKQSPLCPYCPYQLICGFKDSCLWDE